MNHLAEKMRENQKMLKIFNVRAITVHRCMLQHVLSQIIVMVGIIRSIFMARTVLN